MCLFQESFTVTIEHEDSEEYIALGNLGRPSLVEEEEGDKVALYSSPSISVKKTPQRRARISSKPTIGVLNVS